MWKGTALQCTSLRVGAPLHLCDIYQVGLIGMKQEHWVAASPDAICIVEVDKVLHFICAES